MKRCNPENGSAMLVTLLIIAALLAGAAVLVSMQLSSNRSTDLARSSMSALYCAESGLHAARVVLKNASKTDRDAALLQYANELAANSAHLESNPLFTSGITSHDLDGDGTADFYAYVKDNDDELPATNVLSTDTDNQVWLISVCNSSKYSETPKTVSELISVNDTQGTMYDWQAGGAMGNNNYNFQNTTY